MRTQRTYGERRQWQTPEGYGFKVDEPVAGYYRFRLGAGAVRGGVRVWFGPPHDPVTGEELDRSLRWQAEFDGEPIDFERVWPACAKEALTEREYHDRVQRRIWAEKHAPNSAYADRSRKLDPLSTDTPLPF
ncbi:hypothetical protein ACQEPB_00310 [Novosphingobium fluoreni]|uniref:hypothetical protein n=1 Tax=Novosphingobium fluoreni TaxID=1391222 RepID=UPI003DA18606